MNIVKVAQARKNIEHRKIGYFMSSLGEIHKNKKQEKQHLSTTPTQSVVKYSKKEKSL